MIPDHVISDLTTGEFAPELIQTFHSWFRGAAATLINQPASQPVGQPTLGRENKKKVGDRQGQDKEVKARFLILYTGVNVPLLIKYP